MKDLVPVLNILAEKEKKALSKITAELKDTWKKKQIFRTDTEARFSVLNDGSFPTTASKYWQAVREQAAMLESLTLLSFDLRRIDVQLEKLERNLRTAKDDLMEKEIQIDIDQARFSKLNAEQVVRDRVREILMWSQIKAELDDNSFDTQDPNAHQLESMHQSLQNRADVAGNNANPGELLNIAGPLSTILKYKQQKQQSIADQEKPQNLTYDRIN
jgi:hypothetical protein